MRLAFLLLVSCAAVPSPSPDTQGDGWRMARMVEAAVNGCEKPCPADVVCVDDYGLCWTPCAWGRSTPAEREAMHKAAMDADPTSTFILRCPETRGLVEARR
ncbi:MAG TPA: hypothetical protein VMS92_22880 [Mycobacterium sp.]|nr:hypothetical protein [Mycobacterium sp.]